MNRKNNSKGFTLVELLVVIAIIGILSVVAVPTLFKNIEKAKVVSLEADINTIKSAVRSVYADSGEFQDLILFKGDGGEVMAKDIAPFVILLNDAPILSEIDTLSFPFEATYQIMYSKKSGSNSSYTNVTLFIKVAEEISETGIEKLKRDLDESVEWDENSPTLLQIKILSEADK